MRTERIGTTPRQPAPQIRRVTAPEFRDDDFEADADAAARDIEIERDERIAMSGAGELAADNGRLRAELETCRQRVSAVVKENSQLKTQVKMWKNRALSAGWKGKGDA